MADVIRPLCPRDVVGPLLPSLPVAAMASQPASTVLPLLSPIMRQRVQFLSAASSEPWIRLLCYDPAKATKLIEVARSARFEPHPVSGEIEVDWDDPHSSDVEARYKRVDIETLQALVLMRDLNLEIRLVYCEGDAEGGGPGWRIGEVSVPDSSALDSFGGHKTADEAEHAFKEATPTIIEATLPTTDTENNSEDDDDYWAQYDATPAGRTPAAQTPAVKRSPAPSSMQRGGDTTKSKRETEEEDAYFSQYDSVQPAMDNHDPDEAEIVAQDPELAQAAKEQAQRPPLGFGLNAGPVIQEDDDIDHERLAKLVHPRPASFSSSSVSSGGDAGESAGGSAVIVTKLEESAGRREHGEFGVKQHVSRSIKSLYMLARTTGIDRDEFEQLVKTELDMLAMMED
ncbi:hypothetical protein F503_07736 [Ophiostoma piceae UAMH 11346]|uniref:Uncharacterized protein n=1 Tax=Ophiostoma piceae (strain UAMH 11346) TaxID=1262450 RepID=S3D1E0_OPHP1|nr:hypothetical protein F503_07736 [Ophiostoma piceae UAMH 11346]